MTETINEFDILMTDQILDLEYDTILTISDLLLRKSVSGTPSSNTSRIQDITLQPDAAFLSFSQNVAEDLDIGDGDSKYIFGGADLSMEVGRDAGVGREFAPRSTSGSVRGKSVEPEDPLMTQDPSFDLGLGGPEGADEFGQNFDFAVGDDFGIPPPDFDMGLADFELPM